MEQQAAVSVAVGVRQVCEPSGVFDLDADAGQTSQESGVGRQTLAGTGFIWVACRGPLDGGVQYADGITLAVTGIQA